MKGPFGTTIGAYRFLGGRRLGEVVSDDVVATLAGTVDAAYRALSDALTSINEAALAGYDVVSATSRHDEISSALDRLMTRLPALEVSDREAWEDEAGRLFTLAHELRADVRESFRAISAARLWKVGLWTGSGVLLVTGVVLWIRSRKRRRR